jgi:RimJ/RimL family protein N-acetyltransferase
VKLRRTGEADLDFVIAAEADREASPWVTQWSRERHREAIVHSDEAHLIAVDDEGERIGFVLLAGLADEHRSLELRRIVVTEPGRGTGREVLRLAVDRCFREHAAHRVWLDVKPGNERAKRAYRAVGFSYEATMRDVQRNAGGQWDTLEIMSVLAGDWDAAASGP